MVAAERDRRRAGAQSTGSSCAAICSAVRSALPGVVCRSPRSAMRARRRRRPSWAGLNGRSSSDASRIPAGPKRAPGRIDVAVSKGTPSTAASTPSGESTAAPAEARMPCITGATPASGGKLQLTSFRGSGSPGVFRFITKASMRISRCCSLTPKLGRDTRVTGCLHTDFHSGYPDRAIHQRCTVRGIQVSKYRGFTKFLELYSDNRVHNICFGPDQCRNDVISGTEARQADVRFRVISGHQHAGSGECPLYPQMRTCSASKFDLPPRTYANMELAESMLDGPLPPMER